MGRIEKLREQAKEMLKNEDFALRSCWNCNGAHEHLKECSYLINCFQCGHWYLEGIDITEEDA